MTDEEVRLMITQVVNGRGDEGFVYHCCGQTFVGAEALSDHMKLCHKEEYVAKFKYLLRTSRIEYPSKKTLHSAVNRHKKKIEKEAKRKANRRSHHMTEPKGGKLWLVYTPMGNKR